MPLKKRHASRLGVGLTVVGGFLSACAFAATPLEGGVAPERIRQIAALLDDRPFAFGPRIDDRAAWQRLANAAPYSNVVRDAEAELQRPMPEMTESVYMLYKKTGRRTPEYSRVSGDRHRRITRLTRAECLDNKGRFIPALEAALQSICSEKTWIANFHDGDLANFKGNKISIDLISSGLAQELGTCLCLLGDRLDAVTRQTVSDRLRERIFIPYRKAVEGTGTPQWWIAADMNWNSVCHAGVVAAALAACPDREERAFFVAAAEKYSRDYLRGFGAEGYCAEGLGYWNYGFSHYTELCEIVWQATHGGVDLYALPGARQAALYPVRIRLAEGVYPAYADCSLSSTPDRQLLGFLNRRYGLGLRDFVVPDLTTVSGSLPVSLMYSCSNSATAQTLAAALTPDEPRTYFEHGVLTARPLPGSSCRLAVSLKGGHNAEPHNHNDLGTFVVAVGRETPILDPGGEVYTARTFSKQRYDSVLLNSYGHPVPVVAGKLQCQGREARAIVETQTFTDGADTLALDLRSAYEVPELQRLTRRFVYSRAGTGSLEVTDDFAFTRPQTFGSALITCGQWERISGNELRLCSSQEAVRVVIDTGKLPFEITAEPIKEESSSKAQPTRIGINLAGPIPSGRVTLTITPAPARHSPLPQGGLSPATQIRISKSETSTESGKTNKSQ